MHDYRVYLLDEQQKICKATWVQCDSLDQAIERVSADLPDSTCEIWEGSRCLAMVEPRSTTRF